MTPPPATAFTAAHRFYVKSLYKRYLTNSLNWVIRRDTWRQRAIEIRAEFERNRCVGTGRGGSSGELGAVGMLPAKWRAVPWIEEDRMIIRQLGMVGNGWRYFCHLQPLYPVRRLVVQQHRSSIWTSTNIPRNVNDPRALAIIFEQAEAKLEREAHPDPYRPPMFPDGTKWERNIPVSSLVDIVAARPPHHAPPEDFTDSAAPGEHGAGVDSGGAAAQSAGGMKPGCESGSKRKGPAFQRRQ
ncbi:uncharacterized protein EHS24_000398 [Apiotrichum porosum]|uniref:NADH dehydrogenase [ubiquinone] 1 beta subcomplex subunit 9 n=1 Tax=Apiotrichum porosum TaxID=105984 RepID=A0A427Y9P4_9TREE|nr:uncharacterized protein EHS24_000398 [Apiotrichum porosum]RSH87880.1 hypothetical protein EHS24_000398 [Apiotrichum porosum]